MHAIERSELVTGDRIARFLSQAYLQGSPLPGFDAHLFAVSAAHPQLNTDGDISGIIEANWRIAVVDQAQIVENLRHAKQRGTVVFGARVYHACERARSR